MAFQYLYRGQQIVAPNSQISGKDRVGDDGDVKDARPLLLVMNVRSEELNPHMELGDERPQFHRGAEIVWSRLETGYRVHGSAPVWYDPRTGVCVRASPSNRNASSVVT